jgi:stress-induced morphogen
MIAPHEIEALLRAGFPDGEFRIKDLTGTQDHYEAAIVSDGFAGKGLVEQHRLVYAALGDAMKERIHALTFKTYTREQWSRVLIK